MVRRTFTILGLSDELDEFIHAAHFVDLLEKAVMLALLYVLLRESNILVLEVLLEAFELNNVLLLIALLRGFQCISHFLGGELA